MILRSRYRGGTRGLETKRDARVMAAAVKFFIHAPIKRVTETARDGRILIPQLWAHLVMVTVIRLDKSLCLPRVNRNKFVRRVLYKMYTGEYSIVLVVRQTTREYGQTVLTAKPPRRNKF